MAHAINGYDGPCCAIHGHSYELHVTVTTVANNGDYFSPPGFVIDFKELKQLVKQAVIEKLDHKLVLSRAYLDLHPSIEPLENLVVWEVEPSAENILVYTKNSIGGILPPGSRLYSLKLFETKDSYAEWVD